MDQTRYSSNHNQPLDSSIDSDDFMDEEYYAVQTGNRPAHSTPIQRTSGSRQSQNVTVIPATESRRTQFGTTSDIDSDIFEKTSVLEFPEVVHLTATNLPGLYPASPLRRPSLDRSSLWDIDNIFFGQSSDAIDTDDLPDQSFQPSRRGRSQQFNSTPNRSNLPSHETFGSPIRRGASVRRLPSRYFDPSLEQSSEINSRFFDQSSDITSSRPLMSQNRMTCRCSTPNRSGKQPNHPTFESSQKEKSSKVSFDPSTAPQSTPRQSLAQDSVPGAKLKESSETNNATLQQSSDIAESQHSANKQQEKNSTPNRASTLPEHAKFGSTIMPSANQSSEADSRIFDQSSDIVDPRDFSKRLQCRCSTAKRPELLPSHPTFGSSIMPSINQSSDIDSRFFDRSSNIVDSRNISNELQCRCSTAKRSGILPSHPTFGSSIMPSINQSSDIDSRFFDRSPNIIDSRNISNELQCRCSTAKRSEILPSHPTFGPSIMPSMNKSSDIDSRIFDTKDSRGFSTRLQEKHSTPKRPGFSPAHLTFGSTIMPSINQSSNVDSRIFEQSRFRTMPRQSTPIRRSRNVPAHLTFGSPIAKPNVNQSSDINSTFFNHSSKQSRLFDTSSEHSGFNMSSIPDVVPQMMNHSPKKSKSPSMMEWFDKTVEQELQKRRNASENLTDNLVNLETPSTGEGDALTGTRGDPFLMEASCSRFDIENGLRNHQQTELHEAVDGLAKAEAMCVFEGAVRAAEKAAAAASPEYAEEAAAAGAQGFQAEIVNVVDQEIPGVKPIEVIGYVGITRPKKPKKSTFT